MTAAAIAGTFADFKLIRTRKLAQVIVEIPIEQADEALRALGGLPRSDGERWVAIARLETPGSAPPVSAGHVTAPAAGTNTPVGAGGGTKRKWSDMRWVERFGILCEDWQFDEWVTHHAPSERWDGQHFEEADCSDEVWQSEFPASYVRWYCGVTSRKLIDGNPDAEARAAILLTEWDAHIGRTGRPG